jgi:hypothetical protein
MDASFMQRMIEAVPLDFLAPVLDGLGRQPANTLVLYQHERMAPLLA